MRDARITEFLGDDDQDFRLGFGEFVELQEKTGVGPFALYKRLMTEDWMIGDISEVLRIGLIGGGMAPKDASKLVKRYVINRPPLENLTLARAVIMVGLYGAPEEDPKSKEAPADDSDGKLSTRDYYGAGAVSGFTPQEVNAMSFHQVRAAFDGISEHHSAANGRMSEKTKDELFDWVQEEMKKDEEA